MNLITKELEDRFSKIGSQENEKDPVFIAKFFNPSGAGAWYATEYDPDNRMFFGYVNITEGEWGYFSLDELLSVKNRFGLKIERDLYFTEKPSSGVIEKYQA